MDSNLLKLSGLWINKSKDGNQYLSGKFGVGINLLIFKNKNKRPDSNDPDYNVFLAPAEPKDKPKPEAEPADF